MFQPDPEPLSQGGTEAIIALIMEKTVRITTVEKQDDLRREDMMRLTPVQRMEAMIELRDQLYPYKPLERVVTIRQLD